MKCFFFYFVVDDVSIVPILIVDDDDGDICLSVCLSLRLMPIAVFQPTHDNSHNSGPIAKIQQRAAAYITLQICREKKKQAAVLSINLHFMYLSLCPSVCLSVFLSRSFVSLPLCLLLSCVSDYQAPGFLHKRSSVQQDSIHALALSLGWGDSRNGVPIYWR